MSQEGEREKKLNHNFNIERIIATTRQLSSHFTTQKSNLHWLGHNYINKTTTETSHTFLENKNCFLLLHHNEKKKSGIEANTARDGGRTRRISSG